MAAIASTQKTVITSSLPDTNLPLGLIPQKIFEISHKMFADAQPFFAHKDRLVYKMQGFLVLLRLNSRSVSSGFFEAGTQIPVSFVSNVAKTAHNINILFKELPNPCTATMHFSFRYVLNDDEQVEKIIPTHSTTGFTISKKRPHGNRDVEKIISFQINNPEASGTATPVTTSTQPPK